MIRTLRLISCFGNSKKIFKTMKELVQITREMQENTSVYPENYTAQRRAKKESSHEICVEENSTFQCAKNVLAQDKKIAVLNFANPYKPGGDVALGAMAQEECLCRSSNLIFSLSMDCAKVNFYKWNKKCKKNVFSDRVVYSPNVCVIKSDDVYPEMLESPFFVDVISSAAPRVTQRKLSANKKQELEKLLYSRIKNILEVAIQHQVDILVLGAFGCGMFHNPPELVADVFKKLLIEECYEEYFEKIIFAIKGNRNNINVFKERLNTFTLTKQR